MIKRKVDFMIIKTVLIGLTVLLIGGALSTLILTQTEDKIEIDKIKKMDDSLKPNIDQINQIDSNAIFILK